MITIEQASSKVKLVRYDDIYFDDIYNIFHQEDRYLWTHYSLDMTYRDFEVYFMNKLAHDYHIFKVILNKKDQLIGFIYSYNYNKDHLRCYTTCYIVPQYRHIGYAVCAGILFYNQLFENYPLIKICNDVFDYNDSSNHLMTSLGFHLDGILRNHRYYKHDFHDLYQYSLLREEYYTLQKE